MDADDIPTHGGYNLDDILLFNKNGKKLGDQDIDALQCSQCLKLLRDPYQLIMCGHRFCKTCLNNEILLRTPRTCPEDGEEINERHVKTDKGCSKEIKSLAAVCGGSINGCTWRGNIDETEVHVTDCSYITVVCPQRCGQSLTRADLSAHKDECPNKPDSQEMLSQLFDKVNMMETINVKLQMDNSRLHQLVVSLQGKVVDSENEIKNLKEVIPQLKTKVTNLNDEVVRLMAFQSGGVVVDSGYRRSTTVSVDDGNKKDPGYGSDTFNRSNLSTYSSGLSSSISSGISSGSSSGPYTSASSGGSYSSDGDDVRAVMKKLQHQVDAMRPCVDEFNRLNSQLVGYMETVQTVQESVTRHAVAMEEIKLRQDILDVKTTHGIFIWKIPEIARRYSDAQQRRTLSLYSPPFHTSPHGYRMCIRAYLNGDGSGKGTHISVFFVLMKSEHDNLLSWPFKSPVTFQLLNLTNSSNSTSETFMPDLQSPSFQQPKSEMNIASGFPRFAKQAVLKDPSFTKGDAIFIRCKIDLTNIERLE